jgi:hypothetical protein
VLATGRTLALVVAVTAGCGGSSTRHGGKRGDAGAPSEGGNGTEGGASSTGGTGAPSGGVPTTGGADGEGGSSAEGGVAGDGGGGTSGSAGEAGSGGTPGPEPPIAPCVTAAVDLDMPVGVVGRGLNDFEIIPTDNAVAVLRRRLGSATTVKTYSLDGTAIAADDVEDGARFFRSTNGFLVFSFVGEEVVGRIADKTLSFGPIQYSQSVIATEELLGVAQPGSDALVITSERFLNMNTGASRGWSLVTGEAPDLAPGGRDRLFGIASTGDTVLVAWGSGDVLHRLLVEDALEVIDVLDHAEDDSGLPNLETENGLAVPFDGGLVMVGGNLVQVARMGFDMSREVFGQVDNLQPFYRQTPSLALAPWGDRLIGVWLAVTPPGDYHQSFDPNQVYGCDLDLSGVEPTCASYFLIAEVDFNAYELSYQPIAAAIAGDSTLAVVHADTSGRTWLRFVDLECAPPPIAE